MIYGYAQRVHPKFLWLYMDICSTACETQNDTLAWIYRRAEIYPKELELVLSENSNFC